MAVTAIDEAKRFLDLHPWSTTDVDNPVELLRGVVEDFDKGELLDNYSGDYDEDEEEAKTDEQPEGAKDKLLAFIKGLRDDMKICEAEYQLALGIAKAH